MAEIDLRIQRLEQLYDSLDPAPFHAKALDRNAEAYLLESVGEYGLRQTQTVVIHGPPELERHLDDIALAIHTHFALAHQQAERRHHRRRRVGRAALLFGITTLIAALLLRQLVERIGGSIGEVLAEGLLILAWVALWRPIETIGFDSWESREQRRALALLARIPIRFVAFASEVGT